MLRIGDPAPSFRLASTSGREVSLEDFRGHKIVLYFYPKDETSGCTKEACDFRDNMHRLSDAGAVVLGVSPDSIDSHHGFRANHDLPFDLLSDPDHEVAKDYGAYGEKISYGTPTLGIIRSTIVIDELGYVDAIWSPVTVDGHAEQVIDFLYGRTSSPGEAAMDSTPRKSPAPAAKKATSPKKTAAPKKAPAAKPAPASKQGASPKKSASAGAKPAAKKSVAGGAKAGSKKKAAKKAVKKAARKATKTAARKAATKTSKEAAKMMAKKAGKKAAKKATKKATKKTAKKATKKVTKKAAKKTAKKATKKAAKKTAKKATKKA